MTVSQYSGNFKIQYMSVGDCSKSHWWIFFRAVESSSFQFFGVRQVGTWITFYIEFSVYVKFLFDDSITDNNIFAQTTSFSWMFAIPQ